MVPERNVVANIEPRGISRQPGLRKNNELGAAARCFLCERAGALEPRREVGGNFRLHDRHAGAAHRQTAIWSTALRRRSGTFASAAGYPTGITSIARSLAGLPSNSPRNPIGLGVCVSVTSPMWWIAAMNSPAAMPQDSCV